MSTYFSFQRMITTSFVKVIYFLGFLALTAGGIGLAVWAGLRLHDATIDRTTGWRYVVLGAAAVLVGNLVWRVFCEVWVVLFNIHDRLASIDEDRNFFAPIGTPHTSDTESDNPIEEDREQVVIGQESYPQRRSAGVLGLS